MMDLQGKKAVVLGGTSGIGLAAVQQLLTRGASVLACSRSKKNLDAAKTAAPQAELRQVDVLDHAALEDLFAAAAPFDVLVNAATGGKRAMGPFLEMDLDGFRGSFDKLWGYVASVRLGAPHMTDAGSLVLVSGSPARKCSPGASAISTVGNAVEGFVRAIAPEIAPRRINAVSPGIIDTPMFPVEGEARAKLLGTVTGGNVIPRAGSADEVAEAILFLLTNEFVTGTIVDVDGGALLP